MTAKCPACGKDYEKVGKRRFCNECIVDRMYKVNKKWCDKNRKERKDAGLCIYCGKAPLASGNACKECLEKTLMKNREKILAKKKNCRVCGVKLVLHETCYCKKCKDNAGRLRGNSCNKKKADNRKSAGLCVKCGAVHIKKDDKAYMCAPCYAKVKEYNKERKEAFIAQGLCGTCGKEELHTKTLCLTCKNKMLAQVKTRGNHVGKAGTAAV